MADASRAGWHEFTTVMRFCRKCGKKVTLKERGGLNMRGYPLKYVEHMRDCSRDQ